MADGFRIEIEGEQATRIEAAAKARGVSVEEYVRTMLAVGLALGDESFDDESDIGEDIRRAEEFERTGMGMDGEEVVAWLKSLATDHPLPMPEARKLK